MFGGDIFSVTPNDFLCFEEKKSKCGIVGIASMDTVAPLLMASLSRLEYRGYDSCGAATFSADGIEVRKDIGAVRDVAKREGLAAGRGSLGFAHTPWATHGGVARANAQPHLSCDA